MEEKEIETSTFDEDIKENFNRDNILKSIENEQQINRAVLNCYGETLGVIKDIAKMINKLVEDISILGQDKLLDFFETIKNNVENMKEETEETTEDK